MEIVCDMVQFECYIFEVVVVFGDSLVLLDSYFDGVIEFDVDVFCDGENVYIVGIMQYIEEVGVYFGDFVCFLLFYSFFDSVIVEIKEQIVVLVKVFYVKGLMNV